MDLALAGAAAGSAALAVTYYLDARFHISNDMKSLSNKARATRYANLLAEHVKADKMLVYHALEQHANSSLANAPFLVFEGREWTYKEFLDAIDPIGNWLIKELGIKKGEMVALDGGNSPEFLLLWLSLEAVGACVAFINCNLTAEPLVHCVKLCGTRYLLADSDVRQLVSPVEEELTSSNVKTLYYDPQFLAAFTDKAPLPLERRSGINPADSSCLIYTSGTTGLPKGTIASRAKMLMMRETKNILGLGPGDRMYTCLPLYHASALAVCCLPCLSSGATVVLSRKFSHKTFWPEVHASKATIIQYVGELCRYLLSAPPSPLDRGHCVKRVWGNGMRPDVWEPFRQRFGIESIYEFYAATDGMGLLYCHNRGDFSRGVLSVRGPIWHWLNGRDEARVRIDPDTGAILRRSNGLAIRCKTGESGEMIHRLDPSNPAMGTPVYWGNVQAAEKRQVRDVFQKGDLWFRSGDSMRLDAEGRLHFVDRLGDTFRWHSENVSTTEVGDVVGMFPQIIEANVYGVAVPHTDGRAGCAAILAAEGVSIKPEDIEQGLGLDLKGLAEHCIAKLPRYAVPIFLRIVTQLEHTATMKLQKGNLKAQGIDLEAIEKAAKDKGEEPDQMYWLPPGAKAYVPFRGKDLRELEGGKVRL